MITLEQVRADIISGKCKRIYYSSGTLWWTHLDSDVAEASEIGDREFERKNRKALDNPKVSEEIKVKLRALMNLRIKHKRDKNFGGIPMDPSGAPLLQTDDPKKWFELATSDPDVFGVYGLKAFMKVHHQNCNGIAYKNWYDVVATLNIMSL